MIIYRYICIYDYICIYIYIYLHNIIYIYILPAFANNLIGLGIRFFAETPIWFILTIPIKTVSFGIIPVCIY